MNAIPWWETTGAIWSSWNDFRGGTGTREQSEQINRKKDLYFGDSPPAVCLKGLRKNNSSSWGPKGIPSTRNRSSLSVKGISSCIIRITQPVCDLQAASSSSPTSVVLIVFIVVGRPNSSASRRSNLPFQASMFNSMFLVSIQDFEAIPPFITSSPSTQTLIHYRLQPNSLDLHQETRFNSYLELIIPFRSYLTQLLIYCQNRRPFLDWSTPGAEGGEGIHSLDFFRSKLTPLTPINSYCPNGPIPSNLVFCYYYNFYCMLINQICLHTPQLNGLRISNFLVGSTLLAVRDLILTVSGFFADCQIVRKVALTLLNSSLSQRSRIISFRRCLCRPSKNSYFSY